MALWCARVSYFDGVHLVQPLLVLAGYPARGKVPVLIAGGFRRQQPTGALGVGGAAPEPERRDDLAAPGVVHLPGCAVRGKPVVLRDGSHALIRRVQRGDAPLLADGFGRLSTESRNLRFLTGKAALSPAELRYFTEVDHHDHEALGALSQVDGRGLGIARYIRHPEDPEAAEVAVTVIDEWQGRGLGTELLKQLTDRARQEGIRRFTAMVAADNAAVIGLLRNIGADVRATDREPGTVEYEINLAPEGPGGELQALLRAFGRRQLKPPKAIRDILAALIPDRFTPDGK